MKVLLQSEPAECGLACLGMVASYYGYHVSLRDLRQRFPLSLKGAKLSRLIDIAGELQLLSRPLRLDLEDIPKLRTPCILHWDLNHFVVLVKARRTRVSIIDPAHGERSLHYADLSRHFSGVALELAPAPEFKVASAAPQVSLRQLIGPIVGLRRALALVAIFSIVLQVFAVVAPFFLQWVADQVLVSVDSSLWTVIAIGFGMLVVFQSGTHLLRGWVVAYLSAQLGLQWTGNVLSHLLKLPLTFFERRHLGDVVSRLGSVQLIQRTLTTTFVEAFIDGLMALVTVCMMFLYSGGLAVVTVLAVVMYLALRAIAFQPMRTGTEQQLSAAASQQTHLLETIRGIQSIKVAGREGVRRAEYLNRMNATVNNDMWIAKLGLAFSTSSQLLFGVERVVVVWFGARLVLENMFSVGMLMAYLAYKDQFAQRIGALIDKWIEFRMLRLHADRLSDIVLEPPELNEARGLHVPTVHDASIEVRDLSFRYAEGEQWVLKDCSFSIASGESVAITGASGCGKTTLTKLMLGLLVPTKGCIFYGGIDIRNLGVSNYRSLLGAVMQDDHLFVGSIADNIALGDESPDSVRVRAAAQMAAIHSEVMDMPMGYLSFIGDWEPAFLVARSSA